MAKYCNKECEEVGVVCDFCIHFDFNADDKENYTEDGYCNYHKEKKDPSEGCSEFVCFNIKEKNEICPSE